MKRPQINFLITILSLISMSILVGCGSNDDGSPALKPEVLPATAETTAQRMIQLATFVAQQPQLVDLEHTEKEMLYENREVASTCTRTVQSGTRQECRTEYERRCRTEYERECRQVAFPVCHNEREQVCRDVPDRVCRNETERVCKPETREVCENVRGACRQEMQNICDSRGCRDVARTVCEPDRRSCRNVTENVCRNETRERCERTTRRECSFQDRQVCHNDYRQDCTNVPRERCEQVPHPVCDNVPDYRQEEYACTRSERVAVGERVTLHQLANVKIELRNPKNLDVSVDAALLYLEDGQVQLEMHGTPRLEYRIRRTSQTIQRISALEQHIKATFVIEAL